MTGLKGFFVAAPHDTGDPVTGHYFETASADPARPQVWAYTDRLSYRAGDEIALHAISHPPTFDLRLVRDGVQPRVVWQGTVPGGLAPTPPDCSVQGCNWPLRLRLPVAADWPSGLYRLELSVDGHASDHMVVIRAARPPTRRDGDDGAGGPVLMLLCTGTWCAYNDWGGSNHYQGLTGPQGRDFAPQVSLRRPWARGFVRWPGGAPRIPHATPPGRPPAYPHMDFARANGLSKKYASSGWAAFERPFAHWCERQGITLHHATQHDLHADPVLLAPYARVLIVGHDEYWTARMRDHLDAFVDAGGQVARFAGNFFWQTRLSGDLTVQSCWKSRAHAEDPLRHSQPALLTSYWDDPAVGRPAVASMGLTGAAGVYAGWSRCAAHGAGGFTLYRPDHWAVRDTGLGYGDVLGRDARIFAYEVDGIDHVMAGGLPDPAPGTGLRGDLTIIGLSPATTRAHATGPADADPFIGDDDARDLAEKVFGGITAETLARATRGNGCLAEYRRGKGAVLNAASCEWVAGLIARDPGVETVTRRILTGPWH